MKPEPLFWCVWCEDGGSPTVKHREFETARAEAKRLARNNPGNRFVVLCAALAYEKRDLDETTFTEEGGWIDGGHPDDRLPF